MRISVPVLILICCTPPIAMYILQNHQNQAMSPIREVSPIQAVSPSKAASLNQAVSPIRDVESRPPQPVVDMSSIWMASDEINLLVKYLKRGVKNSLEWGSGGSTLNFPRFVSGRYVSIEHNIEWCNTVKSRLSLASETLRDKVELRCVSVPPGTGGWGINNPYEEGAYPVFKKYIDEIENPEVAKPGTYYDFILIDGRDRVDASIKALSFIRTNSVVALHDSRRMDYTYGEVHKYYDVVEENREGPQGLAILKRKKEFANLEGRPDLVQKIIDDKYNL